MRAVRFGVLVGVVCLATACAGGAVERPAVRGALDVSTRFPAPRRLVAIGDLHGDLEATRRVLRLAGAIDERDGWMGGDLVLVQTGDQLDRGDDEPEILDLFERLAKDATAAGGAVHALNGNHEFLNVKGDVRYATLDGFADFLEKPVPGLAGAPPETVIAAVLARINAFKPGGPQALRLATRNVVAVVGNTVFVHGGVLPKVAEYGIERLNQESREWLRAERSCPPDLLLGPDGPVWSRHYSKDTDEADCRLLAEALEKLGASRMVVGHTVQKDQVTSGCAERVWRIDVGLSRHYGGPSSALEIVGDQVRILRAP
ncbi:MAG: metallophosphoesterase [Holophagales bacterium]|nr:metallophosphoesterase [Holophagales bacterium]